MQTEMSSAEYRVIPYTTPGYSDNRFLREQGNPKRALQGFTDIMRVLALRVYCTLYKLLKDIIWRFAS